LWLFTTLSLSRLYFIKTAEHDLTIAREKIGFHLDFDETINGDKAYVGDNNYNTI